MTIDFSKYIDKFYLFKGALKINFLEFWRFLGVKIYFFSTIFVNILAWILARYIILESDSERIALHYNVDFGIDYYDLVSKIYIVALLGLLIFIINLFLSFFLFRHKSGKFIFYLLLSASLMVNIILVLALISIYLINFG